MSNSYFSVESDIVRTCGYIKDDKYIASVFGVPLSQVRRLRQKVPKYKRFQNKMIADTEPMDLRNSQLAYEQMMEMGSQQLLNSLVSFFNERERKMRYASKS